MLVALLPVVELALVVVPTLAVELRLVQGLEHVLGQVLAQEPELEL